MFKLCLFDLDNTLLKTDDLKTIRIGLANNSNKIRLEQLVAAYEVEDNRLLYTIENLRSLRVKFPNLKLGVFTRSPKSYANLVLNLAYPEFHWDTCNDPANPAHFTQLTQMPPLAFSYRAPDEGADDCKS